MAGTDMTSDVQEFDTIVCVYTCERDRNFLQPFYESVVGKYLLSLNSCRILEVYANPDADVSTKQGAILTVKADERYDKLSLKTLEMIKYCTKHLLFRRIIKIDVAVVRANFDRPEYAGRQPFDLPAIVECIKRAPYDIDYAGFIMRAEVTEENVTSWAAKKGSHVDYRRVFGSGQMPPFYIGACYILSRSFARHIAQFGDVIANEHANYLNGSEDVMIGRLFQDFSITNAAKPPTLTVEG